MREMRSAVGWNRLYSNGVAIRVMLEYIDYWGDQRVGDDGMTPLLYSREEDEGSKQLVLPCHPVSSLSTPFHPHLSSLPARATSNIRQPLQLIFAVSPVLLYVLVMESWIIVNKQYNVTALCLYTQYKN